jgi:AraC-like DNA-binding protein
MTSIEVRQSRSLDQLWREVAIRPELKWTIPDMAKRLCFSVGHFHYLCRKLTGVSPLEKVISIRMEKACVLLLNTDDPLPLVAEAVGYESVYSFSRLFKKHLGVSPGRYRNG